MTLTLGAGIAIAASCMIPIVAMLSKAISGTGVFFALMVPIIVAAIIMGAK